VLLDGYREPMRVALVPSAYAPLIGGVETLTASLAKHLRRRKHEVEVWTARSPADELPQQETIGEIRVRRFVFMLPRADGRALLAFAPRAVDTLRELRVAAREFMPDILHVQCFGGNGAYATALGCVTGIPLLVTLQGETVMDDHDIYERSVTLRVALRLGMRRASEVTGCSAFVLRDAERRFGLDTRKASVIFNGVEDGTSRTAPLNLPYQRYVLGLGRVVPKKGFDLLVDAFARIAPHEPDVALVIGGDGIERETLRQRAHELDLADRVYFTGGLCRDEVAAAMQKADVLVMPSRVEPFGMVILEAWSAGVPVVVTPHGGPTEFVEDRVSGLMADPFDTVALADAIGELLRDGELRRKLVIGGKASIGRFTWPQIAAEYEEIYKRVAAADMRDSGGA
jgi:glycosyltransferase involved in cell wall biosynthesis